MTKSSIYQILIFFSILVIIAFTYFSFFYKKNTSVIKNISKEDIKSKKINNEIGSKIDDLYYVSTDETGNSYEIKAATGELDEKSLDIIKLKNVTAIINIKDSGYIYVSSQNALYNRVNLNTYFYEDVELNYQDHFIKSENMDMNYVKKNIKISGNVKYKNNNDSLNADVIEMNMLTKVSRIFMKNKSDKIKAVIFN